MAEPTDDGNKEKDEDGESNQSEDMGGEDNSDEVIEIDFDDGSGGGSNDEVITIGDDSDDEGSTSGNAPAADFRDADFLSFVEDPVTNGNRTNGANNGNKNKNRNGNGNWGDDMTAAAEHSNGHPPRRRPPWMEGLHNNDEEDNVGNNFSHRGDFNRNRRQRDTTNTTPPLVKLHNEIVKFAHLMKPTEAEQKSRKGTADRVTDLAYRTFGGKDKCEVLLFGSQVTGLCLPGSDIDFVIRFPKKKGDEEKKKDVENPLRLFANAVQEEFRLSDDDDDSKPDRLVYLEVIEQTRVPIVKFTVGTTDVDVCFDQPGGPEAADLMHRFMESMPPLRPLTIVLKHFLAARNLNQPYLGGVGSYLLQLMIVSFLQHRCREALRKASSSGNGRSGNGNGGECDMSRTMNLGSLLLDFFELYGLDFNYVTTGLSVRGDGFYFPKGARDRRDVHYQPGRPFALAVENPLDLKQDVGTGAYKIQNVQRTLENAFRTLLAHVSEPMERSGAELDDSILATIIPPTEEMGRRAAEMRRIVGEENWNGNGSGNGAATDGGDAEKAVDLTEDGDSDPLDPTNTPLSKKKKRKLEKKEKKKEKSEKKKERKQMKKARRGSSSGGGES